MWSDGVVPNPVGRVDQLALIAIALDRQIRQPVPDKLGKFGGRSFSAAKTKPSPDYETRTEER